MYIYIYYSVGEIVAKSPHEYSLGPSGSAAVLADMI